MKTAIRTMFLSTAIAMMAVPMIAAPAMAQPGHCPPGLAKKNNGCMPPGLAKKRYAIGERLPDGVRYVPVYDHGRYGLRDPAEGLIYARVDGDLLLIAEATKRVIDAVVAVDAATRGAGDRD
jgi:hypothetical protein